MSTYHGEPYPGYFVDQSLRNMGSCTDPDIVGRGFGEDPYVDRKWMTYEDMGFEGQSIFAEMNQAILEIIHFEKRFPTKEEFTEIRERTLKPLTFSFSELMNKIVPLTWDEIDALDGKKQSCWGYVDNINIKHEAKYEPSLYFNEPMEPECPWNGISYEDFLKNDPPETALASTTGLTKHNLNHRLI